MSVPAALGRILAAAWLMLGVTGCAIGLGGMIANLLGLWLGPEAVSGHVADPFGGRAPVALVGLALLAALEIARRSGLTKLPSAAMVSAAGAAGFGCMGSYALISGLAAGSALDISQGAADLVAGLVFAPTAWRALRSS